MHLSVDTPILPDATRPGPLLPMVSCGGVCLDVNRRRGMAGNADLGLSPAEFDVLYCLVRRRGLPMSKEAIGARLPTPVDPRMVDVYVFRARAKLAAAGLAGTIETVWGRGYMACDSDQSGPAEPPTLRGLGAALVPA